MFGPQFNGQISSLVRRLPSSFISLALQKIGESLVHYFMYVMSGSKNCRKGLGLAVHDHI